MICCLKKGFIENPSVFIVTIIFISSYKPCDIISLLNNAISRHFEVFFFYNFHNFFSNDIVVIFVKKKIG